MVNPIQGSSSQRVDPSLGRPIIGTAGPSSTMSYSQTMPHLNYTQQDIQEQYMGASTSISNITSSTTNKLKQANKQRSRAQSSDSKKPTNFQSSERQPPGEFSSDNESSSILDQYNNNNNKQADGSQRDSRDRSRANRKNKNKNKRRSKSASIFSSCFNISNQLAQQLPTRRPRILAQLGLTSNTNSNSNNNNDNYNKQQQQFNNRPISTKSKTMVNLQQVYNSSDNDENQCWPSSGTRTKALAGSKQISSSSTQGTPTQGRKHVSFGSRAATNTLNNNKQPQQSPNYQPGASNWQSGDGIHQQYHQQTPSNLLFKQQEQQTNQMLLTNSNSGTATAASAHQSSAYGGSNSTVIMRNYQAFIREPTQELSSSQDANSLINENSFINRPHQRDVIVTNLFSGSPVRIPQSSTKQADLCIINKNQIHHSSKSSQQQTASSSSVYNPSSNVITRQPASNKIITKSALGLEETPGAGLSQVAGSNTKNIRAPTSSSSHTSDSYIKEKTSPLGKDRFFSNGGGGCFKRIAPAPMRTQATQTDITSYHLMMASATPSSSTTSTLRRPLSSAAHEREREQDQVQYSGEFPASGSVEISRPVGVGRTRMSNDDNEEAQQSTLMMLSPGHEPPQERAVTSGKPQAKQQDHDELDHGLASTNQTTTLPSWSHNNSIKDERPLASSSSPLAYKQQTTARKIHDPLTNDQQQYKQNRIPSSSLDHRVDDATKISTISERNDNNENNSKPTIVSDDPFSTRGTSGSVSSTGWFIGDVAHHEDDRVSSFDRRPSGTNLHHDDEQKKSLLHKQPSLTSRTRDRPIGGGDHGSATQIANRFQETSATTTRRNNKEAAASTRSPNSSHPSSNSSSAALLCSQTKSPSHLSSSATRSGLQSDSMRPDYLMEELKNQQTTGATISGSKGKAYESHAPTSNANDRPLPNPINTDFDEGKCLSIKKTARAITSTNDGTTITLECDNNNNNKNEASDDGDESVDKSVSFVSLEPPKEFKDHDDHYYDHDNSNEHNNNNNNNNNDDYEHQHHTTTRKNTTIYRIESQPSLSEASSQTDASLAPNIVKIGKSLMHRNRQLEYDGEHGQQSNVYTINRARDGVNNSGHQLTKSHANEFAMNSNSNNKNKDNEFGVAKETELDQNLWSDDEDMSSLSAGGGLAAEESGGLDYVQLANESSRSNTANSCSSLINKQSQQQRQAGYSTNGQREAKHGSGLAMSSSRVKGPLSRRGSDSTISPPDQPLTPPVPVTTPPDYVNLDPEANDDDDLRDELLPGEQLPDSRTDDQHWLSQGAERRRDNFLQLNKLGLANTLEASDFDGNEAGAVHMNKKMSLIELATANPALPDLMSDRSFVGACGSGGSASQANQQQQFNNQDINDRKLSSTSTLSTRHHSYCSSDELVGVFPVSTNQTMDMTSAASKLLEDEDEMELFPSNEFRYSSRLLLTSGGERAAMASTKKLGIIEPEDEKWTPDSVSQSGQTERQVVGLKQETKQQNDDESNNDHDDDNLHRKMEDNEVDSLSSQSFIGTGAKFESGEKDEQLESLVGSTTKGISTATTTPSLLTASGGLNAVVGDRRDLEKEAVVVSKENKSSSMGLEAPHASTAPPLMDNMSCQNDDDHHHPAPAQTYSKDAQDHESRTKPEIENRSLTVGESAAVPREGTGSDESLRLERGPEELGTLKRDIYPTTTSTKAHGSWLENGSSNVSNSETNQVEAGFPRSHQGANQVFAPALGPGGIIERGTEIGLAGSAKSSEDMANGFLVRGATTVSIKPSDDVNGEEQEIDKQETLGACQDSEAKQSQQATVRGGGSSNSDSNNSHHSNSSWRASKRKGDGSAAVPARSALSQSNSDDNDDNSAQLLSIDGSPMTVSELDEDELSTPSFLDTYKRRYEQVYELANRVVGGAIDDCVPKQATVHDTGNKEEPSNGDSSKCNVADSSPENLLDNLVTKRAPIASNKTRSVVFAKQQETPVEEPACRKPVPSSFRRHPDGDESDSDDQDDEGTTSTSISGHERECCGHPSSSTYRQGHPADATIKQAIGSDQPFAGSSRPPLPHKPIHLKPTVQIKNQTIDITDKEPKMRMTIEEPTTREPEAAAAIAVTATTLAGAAARHSSLSSERQKNPSDSFSSVFVSKAQTPATNNNEEIATPISSTTTTSSHNDDHLIESHQINNNTKNKTTTPLKRTTFQKPDFHADDVTNSPNKVDDEQLANPGGVPLSYNKQRNVSAIKEEEAEFCSSPVCGGGFVSPCSSVCSAASVIMRRQTLEEAESVAEKMLVDKHARQQTQSSEAVPIAMIAANQAESGPNPGAEQPESAADDAESSAATEWTLISSQESLKDSFDARQQSPLLDSLPKNNNRESLSYEQSKQPLACSYQETTPLTERHLDRHNNTNNDEDKSEGESCTSTTKEIIEGNKSGSSSGKLSRIIMSSSALPSQSTSVTNASSSSINLNGPSSSGDCILTASAPTLRSGSQATLSGSTAASSGVCRAQSGNQKSPVVDCPYVHDLLVVSPNPSESPVHPSPTFQAHAARLSHDDTMEAIEDDVEGEQMELELAKRQLEEAAAEIEAEKQKRGDQKAKQMPLKDKERILGQDAQQRQQEQLDGASKSKKRQLTGMMVNPGPPPGFGGSSDSVGGGGGEGGSKSCSRATLEDTAAMIRHLDSAVDDQQTNLLASSREDVNEEPDDDADDEDENEDFGGQLVFDSQNQERYIKPRLEEMGGRGDEQDEDEDEEGEESSISVSHRGVLVSQESSSRYGGVRGSPTRDQQESAKDGPASSLSFSDMGPSVHQDGDLANQRDEGQQQPHHDWPAKSMSNESGTQAILEHLALHQVVGDSMSHVVLEEENQLVVDRHHQENGESASLTTSHSTNPSEATLTRRRKSWRENRNQNSNSAHSSTALAGPNLIIETNSIPSITNDASDTEPVLIQKNGDEEFAAPGHQTDTIRRRKQQQHQHLSPIETNRLTTSDSLETAQGSQEDVSGSHQATVANRADDSNLQQKQELPLPRSDQDGDEDAGAQLPMEPTLMSADTAPSNQPTARRGPPIHKLRAGQREHAEDQPAPVTSCSVNNSSFGLESQNVENYNNNNDSICSSCSCRDQSSMTIINNNNNNDSCPIPSNQPGSDSVDGSGSSFTTMTGGATTSGVCGSGYGYRSGQWASQEEGTVFTENYWLSHWLYISEQEESEVWRRSIDMSNHSTSNQTPEEQHHYADPANGGSLEHPFGSLPKEMNVFSSTNSEDNFCTKYKSITRKMIHRRATIEMYKRIQGGTMKPEKRVDINRSNGEFGFRIHGSRPVVVSAIESGTSAETCGLEVGDLIYAINGTNILDMAHSDVVRLAHNADSSSLELDLIPTNEFLRTKRYDESLNRAYETILSGYLMRLSPSTAQPLLVDLQRQLSSSSSSVSTQQRVAKLTKILRLAWRRRYFVLRRDNCLYWYKSKNDFEPQGGINLQGFSATITNEFSEPTHVIRLIKYGGSPHYFGTNNLAHVEQWIDAINKAATEANQNDPYMRRTLTLAKCRPNQFEEPDCAGYLCKYSRKLDGGAHWKPIYFILKDACLYLFRDQNATSGSSSTGGSSPSNLPSTSSSAKQPGTQASAVVYLHGYRVRSKHIEGKKHTFEIIPPTRKTMRPMFLMAPSEIEKKRWMAALEYTIDRWIEID